MKNWRNIFVVLGIGMMLVVAYMVPTFLTVVEDRHLHSESKKYEIEEITLNSEKGNLAEKLSDAERVLSDYVVVQKGRPTTDTEHIEKGVKEYLTLLTGDKAPEILAFSAIPLVMTETNADKLYSLYKCYIVTEKERTYTFWVDEETEKVLAFGIPFSLTEDDTEAFYKMAENMAKYYGFSAAELAEPVKSFLKCTSYTETVVSFLDEAKGTEVVLPLYRNKNQLSFNINMYPKEVMVYDAN